VNQAEHSSQQLRDVEAKLLRDLRELRRKQRASPPSTDGPPMTFGQKVSDTVASTMGSWPFIIIQSGILALWIALNITAWIKHWDPYPFILLNLALSFQAAYAAPFIMMSQNRQQDVDREEAKNDYRTNVKAELEIELLHEKIDALRDVEVRALTQAVADLTELLKRKAV
jgi:uncharacterized membrane protein